MSTLDPSRATSATDVSELVTALYGAPLGAMRGVLHVVAVAEEDGAPRVMKIGPHAPKSAEDFFVLNVARARVESILVTGAVLRAEPELRYELTGPGESPRGLAAFRESLALTEPPILLVLTAGELALDHPALHGWARPIVFTTREAAARLRGGPIEIVGVSRPSARAAIDYLLGQRGCRSVSIEAGARTAAPLYDPPPVIDEVMRSVYDGALDPRARGGELPSPSHLTRTSSTRSMRDPAWRFERWSR